MGEILRALLFIAAQRAHGLEFAEQQGLIPREVALINLEHVHAAI